MNEVPSRAGLLVGRRLLPVPRIGHGMGGRDVAGATAAPATVVVPTVGPTAGPAFAVSAHREERKSELLRAETPNRFY